MKLYIILLLALSTPKVSAIDDENAQQWASICKDFEKDTIAGAGYNNGFCTTKELSKKYAHNNRLISANDFIKTKKYCYHQADFEQNQNNKLVIDLIIAHKKKILALLGLSASIAFMYHFLTAKN